jgi:hypothetical protein
MEDSMEFLLRLAFDLLFRILFSLPGWIAAHVFRLHGSVHAEGLSLADSPHLSSKRTHPESDYVNRFARTQTESPIAFLFWPRAVAVGRSSC